MTSPEAHEHPPLITALYLGADSTRSADHFSYHSDLPLIIISGVLRRLIRVNLLSRGLSTERCFFECSGHLNVYILLLMSCQFRNIDVVKPLPVYLRQIRHFTDIIAQLRETE